MGYTHYWRRNRGFTDTEWNELQDTAVLLFEAAAEDALIDIQYEDDDPRPPQADSQYIRFNGAGEEGHETFFLAKAQEDFAFCKTARKPYDAVVVAILMEAERICSAFSWASDGDGESELKEEAKALLESVKEPIL